MKKKQALLISCFDWYERRLEPIKEILTSEYDVTVVMSDFNHLGKKTETGAYDGCTYVHVLPYKKNISFRRIFSHLQFAFNVKKIIKRIKPDFVYLLVPPNSVASVVSRYKRSHDFKLAVDVIDLWPESMPVGVIKKTILARLWRNLRNVCIKKADLVVTECDLYKEKLSDVLQKKNVMTSYLFKETKLCIANEIYKSEKNKIIVGYVGSINNLIDIEKIDRILHSLKEAGFEIECKIIGDGDHREEFLDTAKNTSEVQYFGKIFDEEEKYSILKGCDFGLNIMKSSVSVGLTIKSLDYLSYGIPLINNIPGDTWKLVKEKRIGINVTDDMQLFITEIMNNNFDRSEILNCYEELFTRDAYLKNMRKALMLIGAIP